MNRIDELFLEKKSNILSVYFTAGHPGLKDTVTIIKELEKNGVDMIEIGMPFSDPMADGIVIQQSSQVALKNGMSLKLLFKQLADIRNEVKIPLLLMGYLNPVLQYGIKEFCKKSSETGIDGIILPDLPVYEYLEEYKENFISNNLHNIFLVSPETSEKRLRLLDAESSGFIYMVSSSSTTGAKQNIQNSQLEYFNRIKNMNLKNPTVIGFGISNHETFSKACEYANGAIIGSAFVKALENDELSLEDRISGFIKGVNG